MEEEQRRQEKDLEEMESCGVRTGDIEPRLCRILGKTLCIEPVESEYCPQEFL